MNTSKKLTAKEWKTLSAPHKKILGEFANRVRIDRKIYYILPYEISASFSDKAYETRRLAYQKLWYALFFKGYSGQVSGGHRIKVTKAVGSRVQFDNLPYQGKKITDKHLKYQMQAQRDKDLYLGFDKILSSRVGAGEKSNFSGPSICKAKKADVKPGDSMQSIFRI